MNVMNYLDYENIADVRKQMSATKVNVENIEVSSDGHVHKINDAICDKERGNNTSG